MKHDDKKAAIAAYKERKSPAGIFAIRCGASGQVWVGQTLDLDKIQNRIWFMLRSGSHSNRVLQDAWTTHGVDSLTFERLEQLEDEESSYVRDGLLKERMLHWRSTLTGLAI
jgi:hypothetical protein